MLPCAPLILGHPILGHPILGRASLVAHPRSRPRSGPGRQLHRLLQEFYDAHKDRVTLVCAVSGATKDDPEAYAVRLVPVSDVAGPSFNARQACRWQGLTGRWEACGGTPATTALFAAGAGVHAYSVQPTLPAVRAHTPHMHAGRAYAHTARPRGPGFDRMRPLCGLLTTSSTATHAPPPTCTRDCAVAAVVHVAFC